MLQTTRLIKTTPEIEWKNRRQKESSLAYGLRREMEILNVLNTAEYFDDGKLNKYPPFYKWDFYGDYFHYEVKSLRYSVKKYPTAVMNVSKIRNMKPQDELILIFSYTEDDDLTNDLYFYQYDPAIVYNERYISPYERNYDTLVFDIDIDLLEKLEFD